MRNMRGHHDNRTGLSIKLIITAAKVIGATDNTENLRFSRVRMIVGAFAGGRKCLPHADHAPGFLSRRMNNNVAAERCWGNPFLTGLRHYGFGELNHAGNLP